MSLREDHGQLDLAVGQERIGLVGLINALLAGEGSDHVDRNAGAFNARLAHQGAWTRDDECFRFGEIGLRDIRFRLVVLSDVDHGTTFHDELQYPSRAVGPVG